MIKPFEFMLSLARVCNNSDGYIILKYKGNEVGWIQPQTNKYTTLRDMLEDYKWEDYPDYSSYDDESYLMWVNGEVAIKFDSYEEYWI